mgnify:CR=1 FL=1
MKVEKGLKYTKDHEWVKVEGNIATLGLTEYAAEHLGDIVYIDLPAEGDEFDKGDSVAAIESVKAASDLYTQVAGKVTEVNEELDDDPALVNNDAYANWIVKLEITDDSELENLLSDEDYEKLLAEEA